MFDQPARDANGNLRDGADTEFCETELDTRPLPTRSAEPPTSSQNTLLLRRPTTTATLSSHASFELPDLVNPSDSEGTDDEMDIDTEELASILPSRTIPGRYKAANSQAQTRAATATTAPSAKRKQNSESAIASATKRPNHQATIEVVEHEDIGLW
ncbi:hypothetical protein K438DRAFT_1753634 [Mycena galopus ATCC 62051]|nr:hypothetical protein K438DRAFT_1753634 [Mycena galopus ATCC 62051]